ncbi:MAG: hypothetical protein J6031_06685, partial [Bacteroidales bacterium]|nr:hypothetical protein [Bacteroidales bacterium]
TLEHGQHTFLNSIPIHGLSVPEKITLVDAGPYSFKLRHIVVTIMAIGIYNFQSFLAAGSENESY